MIGANGSDARAVVAVIGAGIQGSAMVRNLLAAGVQTRVRDADVVITMLPTAGAVESVIFDGGVAGAFADGCVWAQMGAIGIEATLGIRDRLAAQRPSVMFVDAPVSGSKGPAEQRELLILASGPVAAAGWVAPVFGIGPSPIIGSLSQLTSPRWALPLGAAACAVAAAIGYWPVPTRSQGAG
jgi:3-hydroxyisobutyrate dehydrogenase